MVAVLIAAPFGVVPHWLIYLAIGCLLYHVVKIIRKFAD